MQGYDEAVQVSPRIRRLVAPNPSVMTGPGTNTYLIGTDEVAVMQDGTEIRPRGQYDDECVKVNGAWLFSRRVFKVLHGE